MRAAGLLLAAAGLGFASAQWAAARALPIEPLPSKAVVLSAVVRGVDVLPDGRRLVLENVVLAPGEPPLRRLVRVRPKRGDDGEVAAGDRIEVRALLRPPSNPAYPGGWDQQRDAFFSGIGGGGTALSAVRVIERAARRARDRRAGAAGRDRRGARHGGAAGPGRRGRGDVADRHHAGDPGGRPGGVP